MAFSAIASIEKFPLLALSLSCQLEILPVNQLTLGLAVAVTLEKELSLHYDGFIAFHRICLPTFRLEVHTRFGGYVSNESYPGDTDTDDGQEQQSVKQKQTCG